jgi:hypothetical protein
MSGETERTHAAVGGRPVLADRWSFTYVYAAWRFS